MGLGMISKPEILENTKDFLDLIQADHLNADDIYELRTLFEEGVYVDARNSQGKTLLNLIIERGQGVWVVQQLLDARIDIVNIQDEDGHGPLHYAAIREDNRVVQKLLAAGAKVNVKNKNKHGDTPLSIAIALGNINIVRMLLNALEPTEIDVSIENEIMEWKETLNASDQMSIGLTLLEKLLNAFKISQDDCLAPASQSLLLSSGTSIPTILSRPINVAHDKKDDGQGLRSYRRF